MTTYHPPYMTQAAFFRVEGYNDTHKCSLGECRALRLYVVVSPTPNYLDKKAHFEKFVVLSVKYD